MMKAVERALRGEEDVQEEKSEPSPSLAAR